jgi:hypothetical protein
VCKIKLQGNGGLLSYPFVIDGYKAALYEYWETFILNNKKRTIL